MIFYCDSKRHLVCTPYRRENLHRMAVVLGIKECWFHDHPRHPHYDIPKKRVAEIQSKCQVVSTKTIAKICQGKLPK